MLYCTKCKAVCEDSTAQCPNCNNSKALRQVNKEDYVFLHKADEYAAGLLKQDFENEGIAYKMEAFGKGMVSYIYDSEVMPTDKSVYVKYSDIDRAREISSGLKEKLEEENPPQDDMPVAKRAAIQVISMILFLLLIMVVVFAADYITDSVRGFFGLS